MGLEVECRHFSLHNHLLKIKIKNQVKQVQQTATNIIQPWGIKGQTDPLDKLRLAIISRISHL